MSARYKILVGDVRAMLKKVPDESINCCVTSPPYFGLRNYGVDGQLGLEPTPEQYVANMVEVFREVRRVLKPDGTLWLNIGDSYAGSGRGAGDSKTTNKGNTASRHLQSAAIDSGAIGRAWTPPPPGYKNKDLLMIPAQLALALRSDGWYLRSDIIWHKPNPMPSSVTDRPTTSHEYIFLLAKSRRYYYDAKAIAEPFADNRNGNPGTDKRTAQASKGANRDRADLGFLNNGDGWNADGARAGRNKRSVWTVAPSGFKGAHFATFPPALIEPCILAGCPEGGVVLDPFGGSGTTGDVALRNNRKALLIELNPEYAEMARGRCEAAL
jgi:DNA modification methylase